ncbi:hypothetical protein [Bacillus sp. NPDC057893]|uniref:hypothetical protein n=1 Tax=Bacillus sp. NPDC057893 TaxID=3346273 RepID=UPI003671FADB
MFKTLLAGTLLSTGLLAGGANTENVQTDKQIPYEQKEMQQALEGKDFDKSKPVLIQKNEDGTISVKQGDEIPKDLEKYDSKEFNLSEENI